jgi:LacI family transcriptional regulator
VNLRTIAELSGVSAATVSNVINGNFNKVSEETRKRVEEVIRKTDYKPSGSRGLKASLRTIGMIIPYAALDSSFMINHCYAYTVAALEELAREKNLRLLILNGKALEEVLSMINDGILDGAIVQGVFEEEAKTFQKAARFPVVYLDTYTEDPELVTVGIDDYRGGVLMARYLIAKGHRKLAVAAPDYSSGVMKDRVKGFRDVCRESGIPFEESDIYLSDIKYYNGVNVGQDIALSGKGYTAVAAMSDDLAFWIIAGMRQCGMRIPEELSFIGFDGIPEGTCYHPRLTSVEQDHRKKVEAAGKYLIRMMDGEAVQAHDVLPVQIREGDSVLSL